MEAFLEFLEKIFTDWVVSPIGKVLFYDLAFWDDTIELPAVVVWLVLGAIFFTLRFQFVNLRAFRHAIACVRGRYTPPDAPGEISHFRPSRPPSRRRWASATSRAWRWRSAWAARAPSSGWCSPASSE